MKLNANQLPDIREHHIRFHRISVAASLVVPALLFVFVAWQDYKSIMRSTEHDVQRTTEIFRHHALNVFETNELAAEAVNSRIKGLNWDEIERSREIHLYLKKLQEKYPQVQGIWLADADGRLRNSSQSLPEAPVNVADRDYFRALRQADIGTFVGQIITGRVLKVLSFNVARRRGGGRDNAFDGVVAVSVYPEYFSNFWNKVIPKEDAAVAMIRSDGMMLARAPRLNPNLLQLPPSADALQAFRIDDEGSYRGQSAHDKIEKIYTYGKVGSYNVYIVNSVSMRAALKEWKEDLLLYGALFGCATTALLLLAVAALSRARQEQVAIRHWQDTAGELAVKSDELVQHREHLEELVQQRTEELKKTIEELHEEITERLKTEESLQESEETLRQLNVDLDRRVQERTTELEKKYAELERINRLFVGRELRMIELKERIRELEGAGTTP